MDRESVTRWTMNGERKSLLRLLPFAFHGHASRRLAVLAARIIVPRSGSGKVAMRQWLG